MARSFGHVAITGGSSGIGAALAENHAAPGVRLALSGRNAERLAQVADRCRSRGADVVTAIVDVTDAQAVRLWIEAADALAPLDLVYANAGLGGTGAVASDVGEAAEMARLLVETNLCGVINTASAALSCFRRRGHGQIVLIGSTAGRLGLPHSPVYSASKAAVATYADGLRRLVRRLGIHVLLVEPGFVDTPMSVGVPNRDMFLWTAERSAIAIRRAAEARRARLRFPFQLHWLIGLSRILPRPVVDHILESAHRKARP